PGLLGKFGGHAMAAGLSLASGRFALFAEAFDSVVRQKLRIEDLQAFHFSDGQLAAGDLDLTLAELMADAGPWGQGFPEPQFDGEFELIEQRVVGGSHLKLRLRAAGGGQTLGGIAFRQSLPDNAGDRVRLVYRLEVNEFRGRREAQLNVIQIEALE
ncbi:MAG: single-stranded-DNA-specific exonuclease RecJ, partial [Proteobacteria bacterium]|nr:single-stranded-DNA-specific exonuclease RecJ [Pseudomonadota bacterium]